MKKGGEGMLIIREVEYAIMILDELNKQSPLSAAAISDRRGIPSPFIYRVLKKMEKAGLLTVKRGTGGGYEIAADLRGVTLLDVISAFENTFVIIECMKSQYDCSRTTKHDCCMHRAFCGIHHKLQMEFSRNNLADLLS